MAQPLPPPQSGDDREDQAALIAAAVTAVFAAAEAALVASIASAVRRAITTAIQGATAAIGQRLGTSGRRDPRHGRAARRADRRRVHPRARPGGGHKRTRGRQRARLRGSGQRLPAGRRRRARGDTGRASLLVAVPVPHPGGTESPGRPARQGHHGVRGPGWPEVGPRVVRGDGHEDGRVQRLRRPAPRRHAPAAGSTSCSWGRTAPRDHALAACLTRGSYSSLTGATTGA